MLVNKQVYAVPLRVPRTFYVNSSLPPEDPLAVALGRRVIRTLPYGQEPFNVYQVGSVNVYQIRSLLCIAPGAWTHFRSSVLVMHLYTADLASVVFQNVF